VLAESGVTRRRAVRVHGLVQGVGFRPFIYRLAVRHRLGGFVRNDTAGVSIEIEGQENSVRTFLGELESLAPPHARITAITSEDRPARGEREFAIRPSLELAGSAPSIAPDVATCPDCLNELLDPADRRRGYAFTACARCGPRFTVVDRAPYDRNLTSMAPFPLCPGCRTEYQRPEDRRYHAEATACPACGPRLRLTDAEGRDLDADDPVAQTAQLLLEGRIVAIKGLGGFHVACDARNESAVAELRRRKARDSKPFAVMVADLDAARRLCRVSGDEAALLEHDARPIVLLRRLDGVALARAVAPGVRELGLLLPYTPLHHLLLAALDGAAIVLTSGNRSDEPIVCEDAEAVTRLGSIADVFLTHDRAIRSRCDDSVARIVAGEPLLHRRSRGFAPAPLALSFPVAAPILALGGALKSIVALGRGTEAVLSHHLGDLDEYEAWKAFVAAIDHYEQLFQIEPAVITHDLHPDYPSTRYAVERAAREGLLRVAVQHHHAHLAACLAENRVEGPAIGVTFDGTGYGTDGAIWGGEFLIGDRHGFLRAAHFRYVPMPGGEQAIREPWRMALAWLDQAGEGADLLAGRVSAGAVDVVLQQLDRDVNAPRTSSCGRLFDAVASILGLRDRVSYEGQAAIELEGLAARSSARGTYPVELRKGLLDAAPMVAALAGDIRRGVPKPDVARRFHSTLVDVIRRTCLALREESGLNRVALSGGVFMNAILLGGSLEALRGERFEVYRHRLVPCNDGGLCLGQLAVAAASGGGR
jgi:hydrogenase maturation protein HypF